MEIAIIGAGAAGCFAAANIPMEEGHMVTIYEKSNKCLQKVKVSGGGRCNVTHGSFEVAELLGKYPRGKQLLRKNLYAFGPADTINWFESRGVQLKREDDGRMFPVSNNSSSIIHCLLNEINRHQTSIVYHKSIQQIQGSKNGFNLIFDDRTIHQADRILIATGGFPKPEQYRWIEALGHSIEPPVPSLFTFNLPQHPITDLMGVSVDEVTIKIAGTKIIQTGPILITHWGLSGPVVLKASAWAARELADMNYQFTISVNWLNSITVNELREEMAGLRAKSGKLPVSSRNPFELPKRLWEFMIDQSGISSTTKWGELPGSLQQVLMDNLLNFKFTIQGKTTFKEEFVTCGGVKLSEVNLKTMESKIVPGIFFAGEILDVDGITGGFNFQHAWSSAFVAANEMVK